MQQYISPSPILSLGCLYAMIFFFPQSSFLLCLYAIIFLHDYHTTVLLQTDVPFYNGCMCMERGGGLIMVHHNYKCIESHHKMINSVFNMPLDRCASFHLILSLLAACYDFKSSWLSYNSSAVEHVHLHKTIKSSGITFTNLSEIGYLGLKHWENVLILHSEKKKKTAFWHPIDATCHIFYSRLNWTCSSGKLYSCFCAIKLVTVNDTEHN